MFELVWGVAGIRAHVYEPSCHDALHEDRIVELYSTSQYLVIEGGEKCSEPYVVERVYTDAVSSSQTKRAKTCYQFPNISVYLLC